MNVRQSQPQRGHKHGRGKPADPLICFCNEVPKSKIDAAMANGACTLAAIFDQTFAGCGPCGGSCQPELVQLLAEHQRSRQAR